MGYKVKCSIYNNEGVIKSLKLITDLPLNQVEKAVYQKFEPLIRIIATKGQTFRIESIKQTDTEILSSNKGN